MSEQHVVETIFVTVRSPQAYTYVVNGDMQNAYSARNIEMYQFLCGYAPPHLFAMISECLDTSTSFVLDVTNGVLYSFRLIGTELPEKVYQRLWGSNPLGEAMLQKQIESKAEQFTGIEGGIRLAVGCNVEIMGTMFTVARKWH